MWPVSLNEKLEKLCHVNIHKCTYELDYPKIIVLEFVQKIHLVL